MNSIKMCTAMIHIVSTVTQIKIHNINGINFFNFLVAKPFLHIICNYFGCTKQHSMEVINFTVVLQLNEHQFFKLILTQQIHFIDFVL